MDTAPGVYKKIPEGYVKLQWDPCVFDWLIKHDNRVFSTDGSLVVPSWVSTAMEHYNQNKGYAELDVNEYLNRLFVSLSQCPK